MGVVGGADPEEDLRWVSLSETDLDKNRETGLIEKEIRAPIGAK